MTKKKTNLTEKSTTGLRDSLFEVLDGLRNGTVDTQSANSMAKISTQILQTAKLELEYKKMQNRQGRTKAIGSTFVK